jgi:hypothetical protein
VLALGIGATSLGLSLVNSIVLSPLPYKDASRLVMVHGIYHEDIDPPTSPPDFLDWKEQNHVFEQIAAYATTRFNINGVDRPESVQGAIVSYNLFNVLGVDPIAGQAPKPEDDKPGVGEGILISYGLWQRMFGIDRGVLGKTLVVNGTSRTVIGGTPPGFAFPKGVDLWVPIGFDPKNAVRTNHFLHVIGRLKPDVGLKQAQAEMNVIAAALEDVIKLILRRGIALTVLGIVAGLAGSLAFLGVISSLLYGVRVTDPSVFLIVTLGAAAVAILACYIPARKATRVDPIVALRQR